MATQLPRKLDYSDLEVAPDDGKRYELYDGTLVVTPSPNPLHQRISKRLQRQLEAHFEERGLGEVFNAPIDLILTPHDVFVPDIVVVGERSSISRRGIEAPPLLVVEVLSPSTLRQDRGAKAQRYAALGIEHYWIVDPERRRIECLHLEDGTYHLRAEVSGDAGLEPEAWPGLRIDLAVLWRESPSGR